MEKPGVKLREITTHHFAEEDKQLKIEALWGVLQFPPIRYEISWQSAGCVHRSYLMLNFQYGSPVLRGVNGITDEALLAVLIDRLEMRGQWDNEQAAAQCLITALRLLNLNKLERKIEKASSKD